MNRLRELKDKYKGKSLFIVGNGKSLQKTPLHKMEYTLAMNNIALIYDEGIYEEKDWTPTFYWNTTVQVDIHDWWYEQACRMIYMGIPSFTRKESNLPYLPNVYRFEFWKPVENDVIIPMWSRDPTKAIFHYRMSIYGATQMACYMGFNPIYMVGCDLNFSKDPDKCHFSNQYEGTFEWDDDLVNHENYWHLRSHDRIKHFTEKVGVKVYNATVGGNLEVYDRVNVEDVI